MWRAVVVLMAIVFGAGCTRPRAALRPVSATAAHGQEIYRGVVFEPGGAQVFRYARFSSRSRSAWTSTHISHAFDSGKLAVFQRATHDAAYNLQSFRESHRQRGVEASGVLGADGGMRFVRQHSGRETTRTEGAGAPYVVGPTLFGFASARWDALLDGDAVDLRFVVAERGRSYGFTLKLESTTPEHTLIVMTAKRPLVRATVPPMRMTFDTATHVIVRYEGRIPPTHNGKPVDAEVRYEHVSERYF